ncbi:glycosyltransferase [Micropruina glycogenica]|uniref:Putative teichuronic acid biosynthesis glycosyltransferase TuaH n=1 Tax=Micropruina glycogenica TaxID=75385 RepID=A0A2N9JAD2_9ACTN|nr:glycosyltransferase [Micropruina glycogenica]SPD85137.1 putative teichuronic acid biosynthesis glycosyltransferase TuaH [Micropruina glycogenica]
MNLRELVVCSLESWDQVWRRNQYFVDGLLRRNPELRVLWIEPAADPLHAALHRHRPSLGAGLREVPGYYGRLHTLQPTKWLPRAVGTLADRLMIAEARRAARSLSLTAPVLWVNDPGWAGLLDTGWPAIYDVTDDWVAADRGTREHDRIVGGENRLMAQCVVVVVCSTGLQATKSRIRPVELVQNAVDVHAYRSPRPRPDDLAPGPVALYVGTMHEDRLDVALCARIADSLAGIGARLAFVGPNALSPANTRLLQESPATVIMGPRPYTEVPAYLQHADVLIVPHLVDEFTESLDPIKLYEYEAVGRPIAATPVAGFRDLANTPGVLVAPAERFADELTQMIQAPPERVGPFEPADWAGRVAAMQDVLERAAADTTEAP